jgi:23S rRNA (uracil1939-C5)-methyltransferase
MALRPKSTQRRRPRGDAEPRRPRGGRRVAPRLRPPAEAEGPQSPVTGRALDCPHFPPCAGCPAIPVPYAEQLERKRSALVGALQPLLPPDVAPGDVVHATVPSPRLQGYRNQARLVFRRMSRGGFTHIGLGLYLPGTHRVLHIPNCPIQPDRLNAVAATFVQVAEEMQLSTYDERSFTGVLRYLALRIDRARKHVLATLIVAEDIGAPLRTMAERIRLEHPDVVGVTLHHNARRSNVLFAGEDVWTTGAERLEDRVGRFTVLVSPRSFLQVNHAQAEWIYTRLAEVIAGPAATTANNSASDIVLDLYCGVGGIALHVARANRLVIGVESSAEAIEDARRAAHRNAVSGVRFVASDVAAFLRDPAAHGVDFAGRPLAAVVLNPPRAGCGQEVMRAIAALAPERIAYVSCRPLSLVRDLAQLGDYRIVDAWPVDMIPLTDHIESLTVLERRS